MPSRSMQIHRKQSKNINLETDDGSVEDKDENANNSRKQNKKPLDSRHMLLDITRECQERVQHSHIPGLTLSQHHIDPTSELRNYPICKFWAPQPIYVSNAPSHFTDVALSRPLAYDVWHRRLVRLKNNYDKTLNVRGVNNLEEQNIYNWNFYELAEHINLNPDPFFEGTYDYYYTGGNLALLPMMTSLMPTPLVAHFSTENLYTLRVSKFLPLEPSPVLCPVYKEECASNEIFEVRSQKCFHTNRGNVFATRQKDKITLQQLLMGEPSSSFDSDSESDEEENCTTSKTRNDDSNEELEPGEIRVSNIMEFRANDVPFMSFAQCASDATTFVISNVKQSVRVYDIKLDNSKLKSQFKLSTDNKLNFNILRAWQGDVIIYANNQYICPMDLRTTPEQWKKRVVYADNGDYIKCNMITALSTSNNLNHLYVATSHKLHCLDIRYMKDYLEGKGSLVSFTHQLRQAPLFITTYAHGDVEFVALGSPQAGDVCVCEVSAATHLHGAEPVPNDSKYTAYTLPYQPPTLDEALKNARLSTKCLQPEENIKTRISKCTTGLAFYDMNKFRGKLPREQQASAYLMTANSIGDVYAQTVMPRNSETETETRTNRHTTDIMVKYAEQVFKKTKMPLHCTGVHNMMALREIFGTERYTLPKTDYEPINGKSLRRNQGWQKNISILRSNQDYLTEFLLDIWDIEDTNDFGIRQNFAKHIEKEEKGKFVDDWLLNQIPLPVLVEETATSDHQPETQNQKSKLSDENVLPKDIRSFKFEENVVTSTQQTFQEENTFMHDISEIPNEYQISGIELLDVTELPPRPTIIDGFEVQPIKNEFVNVLSPPLDTTFGNTSNVMVSVPIDEQNSLLMDSTYNFSQRPHSTVEKKRKTRKGF